MKQPLLEILKSHDFPPTLLQFNEPASLLVSGSADASIRVILVPEFFTSCKSLSAAQLRLFGRSHLFGILPAYFYFLAMGIATTLYLVILLAVLALVAAIVLARP